MFERFPLWSRALCFVVGPVLLVALVITLRLRASVPPPDAVLSVAGLRAPVTITRDVRGVPSIVGESDHDVFFAMGYAQAQDRLWQMEAQRRMAQGRLSEVTGQQAVRLDVFMRILGLHRAAREAWPHLSKDAQNALQAFADGVNAWLTERRALPLEFTALGHQPDPWEPTDSIALMKLFAFQLGVSFERETARQLGLRLLSPKHFSSRFPEVPESERPVSVDTAALVAARSVEQSIKRQQGGSGSNPGSNAWVIAGRLTRSGHPILANDPHLGLQIPSLWYAAALHGDKLRARGMALVGLPVIMLGANDHIAWGATNLLADTQDLTREEVRAEDPRSYWYQGEWRSFSEREEVVVIATQFPALLKRAIKPIRIKIRSTPNGPVLSDIATDASEVLALRWTALDAADTSLDAFLQLNYATNWESFRQALSLHVAPTLNILYADRQGSIGYSAAGRIPRRLHGLGMLPVSGPEAGWSGYVSWAEMPQQLNPATGFIVNANNEMDLFRAGPFISHDFADPARAQRIVQLLTQRIEATGAVDVDYVMQMQLDVVDLNATRFVQVLRQMYAGKPVSDELAALQAWSGDMGADSPAPALYVGMLRHLRKALYSDEFNRYYSLALGSDATDNTIEATEARTVIKALSTDQFWCDDVNTSKAERCVDIVDAALAEARRELVQVAGRSMRKWRWSEINRRRYEHYPFNAGDPLGDLFARETAGDGTPDTINVGGSEFDKAEGYLQDYGAAFRQVFEMGPRLGHYVRNSTGQSENIFSEFYEDSVEAMQHGRLPQFDTGGTSGTTTLLPQAAQSGTGRDHR